jgi:hypothetical protein
VRNLKPDPQSIVSRGLVWPLWGVKEIFHLVKKSSVHLKCKGFNSTCKEFGLVDWNLKWCAWGVDIGKVDQTTINRWVWISLSLSFHYCSHIYILNIILHLICLNFLIQYNFHYNKSLPSTLFTPPPSRVVYLGNIYFYHPFCNYASKL